MTRPLYVPTQPQRCAGGDAGLGGRCLACGAAPEHLCQAPIAARPKTTRRKAKA